MTSFSVTNDEIEPEIPEFEFKLNKLLFNWTHTKRNEIIIYGDCKVAFEVEYAAFNFDVL